MKVGDKVQVIGTDPATRTYMDYTGGDDFTLPIGTILIVTDIDDTIKAFYFNWEGERRGMFCRYAVRVCECPPSTLLLYGCTCSD